MGSWGWEAGEEGGPGGLTLGDSEAGVAVWKENVQGGDGEEEGGWEVRWEGDEGVKGGLRISLDRKWVEEEEEKVSQEKKDEEKEGKEEKKEPGTTFEVTHTTVAASKKKKKK